MTENSGRDPRSGWSRPDSSMSLLADLFSGRLLDPGYAEAAARRAAGSTAGSRRPGGLGRATAQTWRASVLAVLAAAGLLLVVAGTQVKRGEPVAQRERSQLVAEIRDRTAETDALGRRVEVLRERTERLRTAALARSEAGRRARSDLGAAAAAAAAAPVSGRGIEVLLDDAAGAEAGGPDPAGQGGTPGRVFDQDLQLLVNGLWAAGATAVAVNGQRITSTTAIRAAGEAILVDYRPLTTPYRVVALGDPGPLRDRFAESAAGRRLRALAGRFGIRFRVRTTGRIRLPAAGIVGLRYARQEAGG